MPRHRLFGDPKKALLLDTHPEAQQDMSKVAELPHIPASQRTKVVFETGEPPKKPVEVATAVPELEMLPPEPTGDEDTET